MLLFCLLQPQNKHITPQEALEFANKSDLILKSKEKFFSTEVSWYMKEAMKAKSNSVKHGGRVFSHKLKMSVGWC